MFPFKSTDFHKGLNFYLYDFAIAQTMFQRPNNGQRFAKRCESILA